MSHHTRTRANLTAWSSGAVSPTEFDKLDTNGFKSINGDEGGVWAPSSVIEIGGDGLLMSGDFTADGACIFNAGVEFNGSISFNSGADVTFIDSVLFVDDVTLGNTSSDALTINATTEVEGPWDFNDSVEFNLTVSFNAGADVTFIDTALFTGDVEFGSGSDVTMAGDVSITGDVDIDATSFQIKGGTDVQFFTGTTIGGSPRLRSRLQFTSEGRVPRRQVTNSGNSTYGVTDADYISCEGVTDRTITLDGTGAEIGDGWLICKTANSAQITIGLPGSGTIILPENDGQWLCLVTTGATSSVWNAYAWKAAVFSSN